MAAIWVCYQQDHLALACNISGVTILLGVSGRSPATSRRELPVRGDNTMESSSGACVELKSKVLCHKRCKPAQTFRE